MTPDLIRFLSDEIGLIRMYVGVENFSKRGLENLGRRTTKEQYEYESWL